MKRATKFRKGRKIKTTVEAVKLILGNSYIYWHDKPTHPGWARGWSVNLINSAVANGVLWRAELNKEMKP